MQNRWQVRHTISLVIIVILIGTLGFVLPNGSRRLEWFATMGLLLAFTLIAGKGITGRWPGALIDERNKMSLSRLQLIAWTVLALGAYLTAALGNLTEGLPDPLAIGIPQDLWWLMGISTVSLVASPLLTAAKKKKQPLAKPPEVVAEGLIVANPSPDDARFADMFKGDEVGDRTALDIAKVQMFFFTLILVLAYGATVATAMRVFPVTELPGMQGGMVALLGISHAGYLTSKGGTHTATA